MTEGWSHHGGTWTKSLQAQSSAVWGQVQTLVGLDATPSESPGVEETTRSIVWATADGELLRAEVPRAAHDSFVAALRQSQSQDSARLTRMAEQRLIRDTEPLLVETASRVPAFVTALSGLQVGTINTAFSSLEIESGDTPATIADRTVHKIGKMYADLYRQQVLSPEHTLPTLRTTAGRVILAVRQDLIGSCDRYDQAFRSFLRIHVQRVEALHPDGHWSTIAWTPATASFRSLCQTLRATQADESLFDEAILRSVGEPSMAANELTRELARPPAEIVTSMAVSYEGVVTTLSGWGLPVVAAKLPATVWSYGATTPSWMMHLFGPGLSAESRLRFTSALIKATRDGQTEALMALNTTLASFINGELAGVASAVSARIDKPRRIP